MSKVEDTVEAHFIVLGVSYEKQTRIPFDDWPWKKARSHQLKCDFYLPDVSAHRPFRLRSDYQDQSSGGFAIYFNWTLTRFEAVK
ncbi:hypothetical protein KKA14_20970 [bacterium]|nr:hypothetical protein [bacterium]